MNREPLASRQVQEALTRLRTSEDLNTVLTALEETSINIITTSDPKDANIREDAYRDIHAYKTITRIVYP